MNKRRFFLMSLGAVGTLTIGWGMLPPRQRIIDKAFGEILPVDKGQVAVNAWIKLKADGGVILAMPKSEMGQGVHTALAMLVAEEMDIPLSAVQIEQSPIAKIYGNVAATASGIPFRSDDDGLLARTVRWTMIKVARELGLMTTGGSSSVSDLWLPLREAAAMAKAARAQGKQYTIGNALTYRLKEMKDFKLLGKATPRIDIDGKVNGSARFGIDASSPIGKAPDVYAAVLMSPIRGGAVSKVNGTAKVDAKTAIVLAPNLNRHGGSGGIAWVAKSYWQAQKALEQLTVEWGLAEASAWSNETITQALKTALDDASAFTYYSKGNARQAISSAASKLSARYSAPYLAHATMEPMNATITLLGKGTDRRATIWVGTQVPDFAQSAAAAILQLAKEHVTVTVPYLGGGFGRRLEVDIVAQTSAIAAAHFGREGEGTLQVIWSREADMQHDFYRPAAIARFEAGLDAQGNIVAWINQSASQHIVPKYFPRNAGLPMIGPDKTSAEGAFDQAYEFPHAHVSHSAVELPIPVGFWRSVGHSHQAFFKESFIDECAHAAKADPLAYRRNLLKNHPKHLAVLDLLIENAGWATALPRTPDGFKVARGLALHESFGSIVAMVAEVSITKDKEIRVHRITAAVDCGFCVNPAGVTQQVESSVAFGLSAALWGSISFVNGKVQEGNFHNYRVLRMNEMPIVETHIIPSLRPPEGMGEPALPPVAPAVANALFTLTGQRPRDLPLKIEKGI